MSFLKTAIAAAALFAIGATSAIAQTTTPAPSKPMTSPSAPATTKAPETKPETKSSDTMKKPSKIKAPQSEISKQCSLQANEKGLKGKPRKSFRKDCMKKAA